ncbi:MULTISPECIES: OFA family MFS transporter [Alteromonas]|jgi:MFS family permease|uniref:Major Facilitator Superfamily protein n=1 Tax=Alteromonas macleodii TaxID=28108 RepID=A0A1E7DE51_ALTMA|nr:MULTISPECIES: OFA family MFS transporter [Alteromonas]MEC8296939.1 OFA family MFS transporter [Pseudomonadota bacterium]OES32460.1 major Facilitator Superfamily protein [Alteromonas macleodii]OES32608.1 major Facilitator Superfamily protein [Alteromonas macleodii]OES32779.1 major Facilitator Superfamily protein [Alteromonas macleodii]OES41446.1 major Facilitator Superfamily protein [Alteromonas macleodii]|tara:strand:- start:1323 stop:3038 length:1716 start_codon:yes stop_codon:yes gene_type:complete
MSTSGTGALAFLRKENIVAPDGYNRWRVPPASIAIHLCIGSVYAWSVFNTPLTRDLGVVASSANDWSLSSVVWIFSVAIVCLGLAAAFAGKWLEKVGPRFVGVVAAFLWGGGFIVGSIGISTHQLWLLYLGYGVLGGFGLGLGYVSPVSTLIRWFPDRRGMATGLAIMGFGGGAMIGAPLISALLETFQRAPEYLGAENMVALVTEEGRRFAETAAGKVEVVIASANQAASFGGEAGVYVVGTGETGAASTFLTLGIAYFIVMMFASFQYRVPKEEWKPEGWQPKPEASSKGMVSKNHVHIDQALKTPQFWLLWIVLCFNVTAGIGVIGVAKTMINEIFGNLAIVTAGFAGTYVLMISVFNMVGRFFWASTSDYIGRKNTYHCFFVIGTLLYLSIPFWAGMGNTTALIGFYIATMIIFTMYGGGFATIPAYLADLFGTLHVGGIHGRLLTAWSTAGVLGPFAITYLRNMSVENAIADLAAKVDPAAFASKFGAPMADLQKLVEAKTVTVARLLEIAPAGTVDPTSTLYNTTMYAMAGLLVLAFIANLLVKPVREKHHVENTHPELEPARAS